MFPRRISRHIEKEFERDVKWTIESLAREGNQGLESEESTQEEVCSADVLIFKNNGSPW